MDSVAVITYRHGALHYDTLLVSRKFTVFSNQNFNCAEVQRSLPSNGICAARKSKDFVDHETKRTVVLMCKHHYTIKLDAYVAGCVKRMLTHSRRFCKGFLVYVQQKNVTEGILCSELTKMKRTPRMITVQLLPTNKEWIDYKWNYRISDLVTKRVISEDAMAWLNTLGGGYSALGDYFEHHAREAGRISLKQFKIALEMGDPPTLIRCRLYYALSLMQTKRTKDAAWIVRCQYQLAKQLPVEDHRLISMCRGIWSRLAFVHRQQKDVKRR